MSHEPIEARQPRPVDDAVVDVCGVHYDVAGWEAYLLGFAREAPGYLEKFSVRLCELAGADLPTFRKCLNHDPQEAVRLLLEHRGKFDLRFEDEARSLARQGVVHTILHGCPWLDRNGRGVNDYLAACANRMPDRFSAWAGLSLRDPQGAAAELHRCVGALGMRGATLIPFWEGVPASDPACKPIYDAATELRVPLWIHTGLHFSSRVSLDVSHWRHVDAVASAYPQITIVLGHGGWPWIAEAVALCLRHRNLYLEFSSHRPAHMTRPGSGWDALLFHAAGAMRERVFFGTSGWVAQKSVEQLAGETRALPVPAEVASLWLAGNAMKALALPRISGESAR